MVKLCSNSSNRLMIQPPNQIVCCIVVAMYRRRGVRSSAGVQCAFHAAKPRLSQFARKHTNTYPDEQSPATHNVCSISMISAGARMHLRMHVVLSGSCIKYANTICDHGHSVIRLAERPVCTTPEANTDPRHIHIVTQRLKHHLLLDGILVEENALSLAMP